MSILKVVNAETEEESNLAPEDHRAPNTPMIGWKQETCVSCNKCGQYRILGGLNNYQPLDLKQFITSTSRTLSVQTALQSYFSASEVTMMCSVCQGNQTHTEILDCVQAKEGLVLYTTITKDYKHSFKDRKFQLERQIYLPFQGRNSKLQSVFELRAFTAAPVESAHHIAVVYDDQGQLWTYDDDRKYIGAPKDKYVPLLLFYERTQQAVQAKGVKYAIPKSQAHTRKLQLSSQIDVNPSSFNGNEEARTISTKLGRPGKPTDFYKPPTPREKARGRQAQKGAKQEVSRERHTTPPPSRQSSADSNAESQHQPDWGSQQENCAPTLTANKQLATSKQRKQGKGKEVSNKLANDYPMDTNVWVRQQGSDSVQGSEGSYLAGRIVGLSLPATQSPEE